VTAEGPPKADVASSAINNSDQKSSCQCPPIDSVASPRMPKPDP